MTKTSLSLQPSEGIVVRSAAQIYAAYVTAGRVAVGKEGEWIERAIREALRIAKTVDDTVRSDKEMS